MDASYYSQFSVHIRVHSLSISDLKTVLCSLNVFDISIHLLEEHSYDSLVNISIQQTLDG